MCWVMQRENEMIVSEFIEWLKTQDQDAIVQVVCTRDRERGYESYTEVSIVDFELELSDFADFTNNPHVEKDRDYHGKKYLTLGESI